MRVIKVRTLKDFWETHPTAEQPLRSWIALAKSANWNSPGDVKSMFRTVDFVGGNRAVFNIGGNNFRLVVHCRFEIHCLFIRFVGTHADYDRIDTRTI